MIFLKILFLQIFWFTIVLYGKSFSIGFQFLFAFLFIGCDYYFGRPMISIGRYIFLSGFFLLSGVLNDYSLIGFGLIEKSSYQAGNLSLWIVFITYYDQVFRKFNQLPVWGQALIGGVAGAFTYWSAGRLGGVIMIPQKEHVLIGYEFAFWAVFFPLSMKLYFKDNYWEKFLDRTIVFSFDKTGFHRHQKYFHERFYDRDLSDKKILVTGATSGIGKEAASFLSSLKGRVFATGRSVQKGKSFEKDYPHSTFISLDMANWKDVHEFAKTSPEFDYLVFNAGSMPENLVTNYNGIEFQCASQLLGHYYLLLWLKEFHKLKKGARVVWVSSGGMYLAKLDLEALFHNSQYEKVSTYANVKRAQVTLVEELAKMPEWSDYNIFSMHPGWVDTDGLKEALPKFYRLMKKRLRSAEEGADTIIWGLLSETALKSGSFYFDRKVVSAYISKAYIPNIEQRRELLRALKEIREQMS